MNLKHILKIMWTERFQNSWLLIELIIIFCILWFCSDFLFFMTKRAMEPKGFDIEHTYKIDIGIRDEAKPLFSDADKLPALQDDLWTLLDRIKGNQAIEDLCLSYYSYPYTGSYSAYNFTVDTVTANATLKMVSPEYFNVFRIGFEKGKPYEWGEKKVVISSNRDGTFLTYPIETVRTIAEKYQGEDIVYNVSGIVNKAKRSEYEEYRRILYKPLDKSKLIMDELDICVRVKPDLDKNFIESFTETMESSLDVGPYFLTGITSLNDERDNYLEWTGYSDNLKSVYSVTTFLIINIFLGILGAFWFRMSARRGEIGLRIALGATKSNVMRMYISETMILLFFASIIASVFCLNLAATDILKEIGLPVVERNKEIDIVQSLINYGLTFVFLSVVAIIAVWYPAYVASKTQPAMALKQEE